MHPRPVLAWVGREVQGYVGRDLNPEPPFRVKGWSRRQSLPALDVFYVNILIIALVSVHVYY